LAWIVLVAILTEMLFTMAIALGELPRAESRHTGGITGWPSAWMAWVGCGCHLCADFNHCWAI
jgi:hypothetical protein